MFAGESRRVSPRHSEPFSLTRRERNVELKFVGKTRLNLKREFLRSLARREMDKTGRPWKMAVERRTALQARRYCALSRYRKPITRFSGDLLGKRGKDSAGESESESERDRRRLLFLWYQSFNAITRRVRANSYRISEAGRERESESEREKAQDRNEIEAKRRRGKPRVPRNEI